MKKLGIAVLVTVGMMTSAQASDFEVMENSGGSVIVNLGYNIKLNSKSSMKRKWITVNQKGFPAKLIGKDTGVGVEYKHRRSTGDYRYTGKFTMISNQDLRAYQVKCAVLDAWNKVDKSLVANYVADVKAGVPVTEKPIWRLFRENEATLYWSSICFVNKVRLATGEVKETSEQGVLGIIRDFAKDVTKEDLQPSDKK